MKKIFFNLFTFTILASAVCAQKIEVKDLVSKHLASVKSAEQKPTITTTRDDAY